MKLSLKYSQLQDFNKSKSNSSFGKSQKNIEDKISDVKCLNNVNPDSNSAFISTDNKNSRNHEKQSAGTKRSNHHKIYRMKQSSKDNPNEAKDEKSYMRRTFSSRMKSRVKKKEVFIIGKNQPPDSKKLDTQEFAQNYMYQNEYEERKTLQPVEDKETKKEKFNELMKKFNGKPAKPINTTPLHIRPK